MVPSTYRKAPLTRGQVVAVVAAVVIVLFGVGAAISTRPKPRGHFCGGAGILNAPVAASPEAAVIAYKGTTRPVWHRAAQPAPELAGKVYFLTKGNPCALTVERGDEGWSVTEDGGS